MSTSSKPFKVTPLTVGSVACTSADCLSRAANASSFGFTVAGGILVQFAEHRRTDQEWSPAGVGPGGDLVARSRILIASRGTGVAAVACGT